jgi:hypothetical protein
MNWGTDDFTQTYSDTFFVPEPGHDSGISLLDSDDTGLPRDRTRTPVDSYGHRSGQYGRTVRHSTESTPYNDAVAGVREGFRGGGRQDAAPGREHYYTGGNVVSSRRNIDSVYDVAWDRRPQRYNPNSGAEWAQLVPDPFKRPYGGGPAPSLAFPMISQSEAMNHVGSSRAPVAGVPGREGFAASIDTGTISVASITTTVQIIMVVLLFIIVILLAMTLAAGYRLNRKIEKMMASSGTAKGAAAT